MFTVLVRTLSNIEDKPLIKYFIWVDDDFELTDHTKLEEMFDIIEETGYDVVGGQVGDDRPKLDYKTYFDIERNRNGFCYNR